MYITIPIPIPNSKSQRFSIPIPSQCEDFLSKQGWVRAIPTGTSLLAIFSEDEYHGGYGGMDRANMDIPILIPIPS